MGSGRHCRKRPGGGAAAAGTEVGDQLEIQGMAEGKSGRFGPGGSLEGRPREVGPENILFHDGTNSSVERQMSELVKNAMMHQIAVEMLRGRYSGLMTAIRGRVA